jgi:hypothetical protein
MKLCTYCRCGALTDDEGVILYRVLPCLVRMCKKEESVENRILAAETLAYLIEVILNTTVLLIGCY